jgi:hypothetical protein
MRPSHLVSRLPAALLACITLGHSAASFAQEPPGLSSGSGQGTGSGRSAGIQRNPTGSSSGTGPERSSPRAGSYTPLPPTSIRPSQSIPLGPGVNVRFPDDPAIGPLFLGEQPLTPSDARNQALVTPEVLENARLITDNYDRSRALQELARESIMSNQLLLAHRVLEQAGTAALNEPNSLRHDQLIIELITTTGLLTETLIREGKTQPSLLEPSDERPEPFPKKLDPKLSLRLAKLEWQRAAFLARRIQNPTYRSEYLDRVVEGLGRDSSRIVDGLKRPEGGDNESAPRDNQEVKEYEKAADDFLVDATKIASEIERPIWRNQAFVRTAIVAGESKQFARALSVARDIENPEARAQGLLLVAESQVMNGHQKEATETYSEVAKAIARVQQDGLRGVLTGFLVDSLISMGRFEDARASLVLYPTESERFVALEAIAEQQGRRGSAADAREWIAREAPPEYRSALYRRVNNGVLTSIGIERSNQFGGREGQALPGVR